MPLNEFTKASIIQSFNNIEDAVLDFLRVIPYSKENTKVWSPKLIPIILDCGSLIDSIFRNSAPVSWKFGGKIKKRKDLNINDFRRLYAQKYNLIKLKTFLYVSPAEIITPLCDWGLHKNPQWWNDYNKIKHDRIANTKLATMGTTIEIICALFEIISQHPKMTGTLYKYAWLKLDGWTPEFIIPILESKVKTKACPNTFIVETKLFATTRGQNYFPDNIKSIKPLSYVGSERLLRFLNIYIGRQVNKDRPKNLIEK
ncbi:hypothetical protein MYX07_00785 [Patescibacteria group bacterium AH-259-L07]|nr:hypothetical protein [Patescibacteria group bacterium AH-259-L07]